ncbi:MAG: thioredoxin [Ruminococcaceae bacterium]|nr:thioredoxin [Oscillospiraceae bacterium]
MINLTLDNFKTEVEEYNGLVVVDLWATWCGPCRMIAPVLDEIEAEMPDVKFCKINVDEQPELTRLFKVQSIPTVAIVKNNTFLDFSVGLVPKEKLVKLIETHK